MKITNVATIVALLTATGAYALKGEIDANVNGIFPVLADKTGLETFLTGIEFADNPSVFDSIKADATEEAKKTAIKDILTAYTAKEAIPVDEKINAVKALRDTPFIKYEDLKAFLDEAANKDKADGLAKSLTGKQIDALKAKTGYISAKNMTAALTGQELAQADKDQEALLTKILDTFKEQNPEQALKDNKVDLKLSDEDIAAIMDKRAENAKLIDEMDELAKVVADSKKKTADAAAAAAAASATSATPPPPAASTTSTSTSSPPPDASTTSATNNPPDAASTTSTTPPPPPPAAAAASTTSTTTPPPAPATDPNSSSATTNSPTGAPAAATNTSNNNANSSLTTTSTTANNNTTTTTSSDSFDIMQHLKDNMYLYIFGGVGLVVLILAAYVMTRKTDPTDL